jgi:hypothetical protein
MKMEICRRTIKIIPENEEDAAFIEDTLGMRKADDKIFLERVPCFGIPSSLAYIEAGGK